MALPTACYGFGDGVHTAFLVRPWCLRSSGGFREEVQPEPFPDLGGAPKLAPSQASEALVPWPRSPSNQGVGLLPPFVLSFLRRTEGMIPWSRARPNQSHLSKAGNRLPPSLANPSPSCS